MPAVPTIGMLKSSAPRSSSSGEAVGIPSIDDKGRVEEGLTPGDIVKFVLQHHATVKRPGRPHLDLRLGKPETGLYSWALPKGRMPEPGEKRLAPQTSLHDYSYGDFTGPIGSGYGRGTVTMSDNGKARITKSTPDSVVFNLTHTKKPARYALIRLPQDKVKGSQPQWLLIGRKGDPAKEDKPGDTPVSETDKSAQMVLPRFSMGDLPPPPEPANSKPIKDFKDIMWQDQVYGRSVMPPMPEPKGRRSMGLIIKGPEDSQIAVDVEGLARGMGLLPDEGGGGPWLISEDRRKRITAALEKYKKVLRVVDSASGSPLKIQ